jgi:hypothetical protein
MNLFRRIATEAAEKLGYPYPKEADERVAEWTRTCLSEQKPRTSALRLPFQKYF